MADETPTRRIIITAELQGKEKTNQDLKSVTEGTKNLSESAKQATQSVKGLDNALKGAGQGGSQGIKQAVQDYNEFVTVTTKTALTSREVERALGRTGNIVDQYGQKARIISKDLEVLRRTISGVGEQADRARTIFGPATQALGEFQSKAISQETQLRTAVIASNNAMLEKIRINNLVKSSVVQATPVTDVIGKTTGAGVAPSDSATKLRNQLLIEQEKALIESEKQLAAEMEKDRLVVQKAGDAYVPYAAKIRAAQEEVDQLNRIIKTGGINAIQASTVVVAAQKSLDSLRQKQIDSLQNKPTGVNEISGGQTNDQLSSSAKKYLETLNPLVMLQNRYKEGITEIDKLVKSGLVTDNQAQQMRQSFIEKERRAGEAAKISAVELLNLQQVTKRFGGILKEGQKDFVDYNSTSTKAFGINRIGFLELQATGVNSVQALASGMNPLHVATMESTQALGALVQGGIKLATLIQIVAPIAAITAAIALLAYRIASVTSNIREFNLSLSTIASGSGQTAENLQKIVEHFKDLGVSADDAKKSVNEVLKEVEKGINPNRAESIIQTALNIQAVPTTSNAGDLPATTKVLTDALTGGIPALTEYGLRLKALTAADVEQVRELAKHVGAPAAVQAAYEKIDAYFASKHKESLSTTKNLWIALRNAWGDLVDTFAESEFASNIVTGLTNIATKVTFLIGKLDELSNWFTTRGLSLGGFVSKLVPAADLSKLEEIARLVDKIDKAGPNLLPTVQSKTEVTVPVNKPVVGSSATETNRVSIGSNANLGNSTEIKQLTDMLGKAIETFPTGWKAIIESASRPGAKVEGKNELSLHGVADGRAVDVRLVGPKGAVEGFMGRDITGEYRKLELAIAEVQKRDYPELTGKMQFGTKFTNVDSGHIGIEGGRGRDTTKATVEGNQDVVESNARLGASFDERKKKILEDLKALDMWGKTQVMQQARLEAERAELAKGTSQIDIKKAGDLAAAEAGAKLNIEWGKQATIAKAAADGARLTAEAFQENEVAGLKAAAAAEAYNTELTTNVPALQTYGQILTKNAVESVLGAQKEVTAFGQVLSANKRLADATKEGTAAAKDAELQNEAVRSTHDALNNAMALGNKTLEERARKLQDEKLQQLRVNESLTQTKDLEIETNNLRKESNALQLETGLTASGATREQIDKEIANLKAIEKINSDSAFASGESKKNYIDIVNSTGEWRAKLAEVELSQRRINDIVLDIADSISTTLTDAIKDAFDGKKVTDWRDKLKDALKDVVSSLSDKLFVKPLLGTLADSLGLSSVGSSLGTFTGTGTGSTVTSSGLVTGTASTTKSTTEDADLTSGISGSTSVGLIGLGASSGSTGSVKDWLNENIGPLLGFSKPAKTTSTEDADLVGTATTTTRSGSSLTSVLGSTATGIGVGGLTSSLLGGNATTGSLVGGALSLGGNLLFPGVGSLVTGLAGGAIGGLTSLFGNNKTSNNAAGANLDLGTLKISGTVSSKDEASNQDVEDITGSVRSFARDLAKETGATVGGSVSVQSGLRDGIKVGFAGSLSDLGEKVYESAQDAIDDIELQLAKNLDGLSTTAKTVLDQLTDPADIQDALDFAKAYDNLKEASDSAFSGIETDTEAQGAYADAMDLLTEKFDDLTVSAEEFGLSLDPINKGLDEATKRLQEDFGKSLDAALDKSKANDFLNTLQDVSDAFVSNTKEAKAIGLDTDTDTLKKIADLEVSAARETLDTLSSEDLQTVVDELKDTAPEISKLAQSLIDLGSASSDATNFLNDLDASINTSRGKEYLNTLQDISDTFTKNIQTADDLGLNDTKTAAKIASTEVEAARATLNTLTKDELKDVVDALSDSAPEISSLAQSIIDLGLASDDTGDAIVNLTDGIKSVKDLASSLKTGKLSGLTGAAATDAAIDIYKKDLKTAQDAGVFVTGTQLDTLAASGDAAIQEAIDAYGNAPRTADLRKQIIKDLNNILDVVPAETTTSIPATVSKQQKKVSDKALEENVVTIPASVTEEQKKVSNEALNSSKSIDYLKELTPATVVDDDMLKAYIKTLASDDTPSTVADGLRALKPTDSGDITLFSDAADYIATFARGSKGTPAGKILVGEKGPEWMLPGYANGTEKWKDWQKVGMNGPEIINQNGGAVILPFPMHPKNLPQYADGTGDFGFIQEPSGMVLDTLNTDTNDSASMDGVVVELRGLRRDNRSMKDELAALKKQIQGGQTQANVDARKGNTTLSSINSKLGSGLTSVTRRSVG